MSANQSEREEIRQYIAANIDRERRKQRIAFFFANLFLFIVLALIGWGMALFVPANPANDGPSMALVSLILLTVAGGLSVLLHGLGSLYTESAEGERQLRRNLAMKARLKRFIFGSADAYDDPLDAEKPKHDQYVRLSDDGELMLDEGQSTHAQKSSKS